MSLNTIVLMGGAAILGFAVGRLRGLTRKRGSLPVRRDESHDN